MAMQRCGSCGRSFSVPDDEKGDHGCPNVFCQSYDQVDFEVDEEEDED